jgi:hypothetical protein
MDEKYLSAGLADGQKPNLARVFALIDRLPAEDGVLCITTRKGIFQIETTKSQRDFQQIDYC